VRRILAVAVATLATVLPACGDDGKPERTIAFLRTTEISPASQDAFLAELESDGWVVGENLTVLSPDPTEHHPEQGDSERVVAGWLDGDGDVDLIVALSTTAAIAATTVTEDVPVLTLANDPVGSGLIVDPREPEGNLSGIAFRVPPDRTLDVARQLSGSSTVGVLWPSSDPGAAPLHESFVEAGAALRLEIVDASFGAPSDLAAAVSSLRDADVRVVALVNSPTTVAAYADLERELRGAGIAAVANTVTNEFAVVVLAPESLAVYRQLARQAARLLDGADVREVPLEDPGEYHLVVRTDIAAQLGVSVPEEVLAQADDLNG
jgi:putative tryptophan/tyrosine transport system substrate-binding protein